MSDVAALSKLFAKTLQLSPSNDEVLKEIKMDKYSAPQQALIRQAVTLSSRLPSSLGEINDILRHYTYLLNTQEPAELDSVIFARVEPFCRKFSDEDAVANRHIVRWADLLQNVLNVQDKIKFNLDLEAEREIKKKTTKEVKPTDESKEQAKAAAPAAAAEKKDAKEAAKEKKEKAKAKAPKEQPSSRPLSPGMIDLRAGFIRKAVKHPDADTLYVSTIDVGEDEPRTICSGLVNFVPIEDMQERFVVVVANLKPVKMRGISSNGMVLCAAKDDVVEFVNPPAGSKPGDKLFFETYDEEPEERLNPKKKIFETIQPNFTTNENLEVIYQPAGEPARKLVNKQGVALKCSTIVGARVS